MIQHNIRKLCREQNISMAELARRSDVPYGTLRRWGYRIKCPKGDALLKVSAALDVPAEKILEG